MNTQLDAIQSLIQLNRKALRELAEVADTSSADFVHISRAQDALNEQFHMLLQQKEELEAIAITDELKATSRTHVTEPCAIPTMPYNTETEKRGRGAEKQFFLQDEGLKPAFLAQLKRIFTDRYTPNKTFLLPDGTEAKASAFLACLYDVCIKDGITSPEAPVSDFSNKVKEAAQECPNAKSFKTAYNTIQTAVREWKPLTGNEAHYYGINVRFHKLQPEHVPQDHKADYNRWLALYSQVEKIYNETKA